MEEIHTLSDNPELKFRIEPRRQSGTRIVELSHIKAGYDGELVLKGVSATVRRGERTLLAQRGITSRKSYGNKVMQANGA